MNSKIRAIRNLSSTLSLFQAIVLSFMFVSCSIDKSKSIDTMGATFTKINDIQILSLCGDHYTRGFQHGLLLNNRIMTSFHDILIMYMCKNNDSLYMAGRSFILDHFVFNARYLAEAAGMVDGMRQVGTTLYDPTLKRSIDSIDILMLSAIEELYNIIDFKAGCSSISTWGESTKNDPQLNGNLVITRHWDYPHIAAMVKNLMLIIHKPSESDEQPWVSVAWAGMIGSCSAMNDNGLGVFLDYDDYINELTPNISRHHPVSLSIRTGIEQKDNNHDGKNSYSDLLSEIRAYTPYFGSIIHVVSPEKSDSCAVVIESNNLKGIALRMKYDNTTISGNYVAATNHFRVLTPPTEKCRRYNAIMDSLKVSLEVGYERSWTLLAGAGATTDCVYSLTFVPADKKLRIAVTTETDPISAYLRPSDQFFLKDFFSNNRF
ncbi:MAG: hypothetical protein JW795_04780 [Chitinivibrionales bacterium]|nr:hypothetical protein [Chitinivibrionales bacterium]